MIVDFYTTKDIIISSISFLFTIPILWSFLVLSSQRLVNDEKIYSVQSLGLGFILSFFVTSVSMLIGSLGVPNSYVPQQTQMYLVNVLCDGFTLISNYWDGRNPTPLGGNFSILAGWTLIARVLIPAIV